MEPVRLREGGDATTKQLLAAARRSRPMSAEQKARSAAAVAQIAAQPVTVGPLGPLGQGFLLKGAALAALAAIAVAAATGLVPGFGGEARVGSLAPPAAPTAATAPAAEPGAEPATATPAVANAAVAPSTPMASAAPVAAAAAPSAPVAVPESRPAASAAPTSNGASHVSSARPPVLPPTDTLAAEAALLEDARHSLATSPAAALEKLEAHAAAFPHGKLSLERELLAIDALRRAGRSADARARGEALLARSKGSLYEDRVRQMIAPKPAPSSEAAPSRP